MATVVHRLHAWAVEQPESIAHRYKVDQDWIDVSAQELWKRVYHLALFLRQAGFGPGQIGAILSPNCHEWVVQELACLLLGGMSGGLYPNASTKDIQYILGHTEATVFAVKNQEFFDKVFGEKRDQALPGSIRTVVCFSDQPLVVSGDRLNVVSFQEALAQGAALAKAAGTPKDIDLLKDVKPEAGAFLIYTSGTTGNPKGAVLTHDNLAYSADVAVQTWDLPHGKGDLFSFLPLCHIAEKIQNLGVGLSQRYLVTFASTFDAVSAELPIVRPSLLLSVPRLWEKMMEGVLAKVESSPQPRKKLAQWALAVGARVAAAKYAGTKPDPLDLVQLAVAERLVLSKIRTAMGLPHPHTIASGAATLPAHVSRWFRCLGLEILEDYGQTESTAILTMTERGVESAGTVGRPVRGTEFKIAEDGEVLSRGRHIFKEYYKEPELTRATVDADGWLKTGDLAEITPEGLVRIRGRKKEIMKTSGGKMVAPVPIEERLKVTALVGQVCMVGDGRKYFSAIITLKETVLKAWLQKHGGAAPGLVLEDPAILGPVQEAIDALNAELAQYEQIKRFVVLTREFSILENEMTPTLKMKRNIIEEKYKALIDGMYAT